MEKIETYDKQFIPKVYQDAIDEVGDVPPEIRNLFTNEHQRRLTNTIEFREDQILEKSNSSLGMATVAGRIVNYTYQIRKGRKILREEPNNVQQKILVNIWATKRLKYLVELHKFDGELYKRLLRELEVEKPHLVMGENRLHRIERKRELRRLTKEYCDGIVQRRMQAYHDKLKEQQKLFEKERGEFNEWMLKTMQELNIDESQVQLEE